MSPSPCIPTETRPSGFVAGPDGGGRPKAEPPPAGAPEPLVVAVHLPEPVRPGPDAWARSDQRIVEILDVRPDLGAETRKADRAGVPADRTRLPAAVDRLPPRPFHRFAALFERSLAVADD